MGGACSTHRTYVMLNKVWSESVKGRDHLGDLVRRLQDNINMNVK